MGHTISEKILSEHTSDKVQIGEIIRVKLDIVLANEITGSVAIDEFEKIGTQRVFDKDKIVMIPDHFTPNKDIKSAEINKKVRDFARKHKIKYFEVGRCGIEHAFLPEQGIVKPGDVVIGGDSHTCTYGAIGIFSTGVGSTDIAVAMATGETWLKVPETIKIVYNGHPQKYISGKDLILHTIGDIGVNGACYKTMEFSGDSFKHLSIDDRFTICNMVIEAGAKNGIIEPDKKTIEYIKKSFKVLKSDKDADYVEIINYNIENIEPQVAIPFSPGNVKPVSETSGIPVDQVVIGSCTNGRIEDMRIAAKILKGKKVCSEMRLILIPATQQIYLDCIKEGLMEIFVKAGAFVSGPTCGPCIGGHLGVLAKNETCIATTNRNFRGRMGHPDSKIYLSSPATAAASAIKGFITDPREVIQ